MSLASINLPIGQQETVCASVGESIRQWEEENMSSSILDRESIHRQGEKQISVDPISVTHRISGGNGYGYIHPYPVITGPKVEAVPPPAGKTGKFMSCSLPNSAASSPRFTTKHKKKCKNPPPPPPLHPLARQHSVALTNLERLRESHLRRSKSCGEGRACQPSVDFDIWSPKNTNQKDNSRNRESAAVGGGKLDRQDKATMFAQEGQLQQKFKCGACLFLPGFGGKGKTVKARTDEPSIGGGASPVSPNVDVVSQRVSLERFECGSWRSSAVISCYEDQEGAGADIGTWSSNLFFDLPVELIRCSSVNDTESPVTTGFMFDHGRRKGVLKNTATNSTVAAGRKSQESCRNNSPRRHVRFSTSSPTTAIACNGRDYEEDDGDLNAFLEAQSA